LSGDLGHDDTVKFVLVVVALLLLAPGCGEDCSPPGLYVCTSKVAQTDCPTGYPVPTGTTSFPLEQERCGNLVQTQSIPFGDEGCHADCDIENVYGQVVDVQGHCIIKCPGGFSCGFWYDGNCKRR
jgi:hypothetical protein